MDSSLLPTYWHWAGAVGCALVVGAAKTGIPGLGFLAVPFMALLLRPNERLSVGTLLPLLCCADVMAVWLYRRNRAIHHLWHLLPWVLIGMAAGWWVLKRMPDTAFAPVIGGTVLTMIAIHLWRSIRQRNQPPGQITGAGFGVAAGVTTTVANAAGPIMSIYLLAQRLPKEDFIAAGAWFFFLINLLKLPIYWSLGQFGGRMMVTTDTLLIDACLVPAVVVGSLVGRRIVPHIPQRTFERVVLFLAAAASLYMLRSLVP